MYDNINRLAEESRYNFSEDARNQKTVSAIIALANQQQIANALQEDTNKILKDQVKQLSKRNETLEEELASSKKDNKRSLIFNIITSAIAAASLVATIIISFAK